MENSFVQWYIRYGKLVVNIYAWGFVTGIIAFAFLFLMMVMFSMIGLALR